MVFFGHMKAKVNFSGERKCTGVTKRHITVITSVLCGHFRMISTVYK